MLTILEIIDTAVKVGLGALVSGVTTYYTSTKTNAHERKSDFLTYKRDKLVEISEKIQLAGELTNKITLIISQERGSLGLIVGRDTLHALETTKDICNLVSSAVRLSALINDRELGDLLKDYWRNRDSLHQILFENDLDDVDEYNAVKKQAEEIRLKLYNQFSVSLEKIHE